MVLWWTIHCVNCECSLFLSVFFGLSHRQNMTKPEHDRNERCVSVRMYSHTIVYFYIRTLENLVNVGSSRHKLPQHLQFCVGDTDPSGQNWSDTVVSCRHVATCWQHFQLSVAMEVMAATTTSTVTAAGVVTTTTAVGASTATAAAAAAAAATTATALDTNNKQQSTKSGSGRPAAAVAAAATRG